MGRNDFKQSIIIEAEDKASKPLKNVGDSLDTLGKSTKKAEGSFRRFGKYLSKRFVITLGDVTRAITAAWRAMQSVITLEGQETALRGQLARMGQDFDTFISQLDKAAAGTVSTADLIANSSRALLLGIPADKIADLLEIAGSRAIATGQSISQAFNDISVGIGRASPLILDNLGFVIKLETVYGEYAEKLGTTASQLTIAQQREALLNTVLRQGAEDMAALGTAADDTFVSFNRGKAEIANLTETFKRFSGAALPLVYIGLLRLKLITLEVLTELNVLASRFFTLAAKLPGVGESFRKTADDLLNSAVASSAAAAATRQQVIDLKNLVDVTLGVKDVTFDVAKVTRKATFDVRAYNAGLQDLKTEAKETGESLEEFGEKMKESGESISANLIPVIQALTAAIEVLNQRAQGTAQTVGAALGAGGGIRARDPRNQAAVDRALASGRTPSGSGRRIQTRSGTVLLEAP